MKQYTLSAVLQYLNESVTFEESIEDETDSSVEEFYSGQLYYWTEGNMSCDGNREIRWNEERRKKGLSTAVVARCCQTEFFKLLSLKIDGKEVYAICVCGHEADDHEQITPPGTWFPDRAPFWDLRRCGSCACRKFELV